jgi:hypothetical protein
LELPKSGVLLDLYEMLKAHFGKLADPDVWWPIYYGRTEPPAFEVCLAVTWALACMLDASLVRLISIPSHLVLVFNRT